MADVEEIRAYVESHPDDHKQRWRLAKKLYKAWDYRSALEHLQQLREVWPDQVPVLRYLAATCYRLGKYDDAESELKRGLADYPQEYSLLEQLAKVYEGGGKTDQAIETWTQVLELKPSKTAAEALERLGMAMGTMASTTADNAGQEMSSHGDDTVISCPHCGESNDVFSKRCVRCHGDFGKESEEIEGPEEQQSHTGVAGLVFLVSFLLISGIAAGVFYWITQSGQ